MRKEQSLRYVRVLAILVAGLLSADAAAQDPFADFDAGDPFADTDEPAEADAPETPDPEPEPAAEQDEVPGQTTATAAELTEPAEPTDAESPAPATPPVPSVVRFDPARMPAPVIATPPLGWRYSNLSPSQTRVLRRGFKLPMDALASAKSSRDLLSKAVVAPLPDPSRPMLATGQATGASDPFTGAQSVSFRDDPMAALGQLLGADPSKAGEFVASSGSPFDGGDGLDLDDASRSADASAEVGGDSADAGDDPFATDAGEDPFADF